MPEAMSDGVRIHYEIEGNGPALVLQHGWALSLNSWREAGYVAALRDDFRLVLVDARGHGLSDKPHEVEAYSYRQMAVDVLTVLDDIGVAQAHFWGYSMGGGVGFHLGREAPDRILSLIIGGLHPFPMASDQNDRIDQSVRDLRQGMETFVASVEQRFGPVPADVRAAWIAGNDGLALAASQEGQMPDDRAGLREPFSDLVMPCLLYAGTKDGFASELSRAAEMLPHADVVLLGGLDHGAALDRSDRVLPFVTRFLQQATRRADRPSHIP